MDNYKCKTCGKEHAVFKAVEVSKPERILEIAEAERAQRVKEIQGSYLIDDTLFLLQGDIFIYKEEEEKPFFTWSVWVSISLADFQSKAKELEERKNVVFDGQLETALPFYKKTKGLKVKVFINLDYDYSVVKIAEASPIKKDQSEKITDVRVMTLLDRFYHPLVKS